MRVLNARRIRVWLAENGLCQGDLAVSAGLAEATLSRAMSGKQLATSGIVLSLHETTGLPVTELTVEHPDVEEKAS